MDERAALIEAVRQIQAEEKLREMTDEQLMEVICSALGLPRGTPFSDEQLRMIAEHG